MSAACSVGWRALPSFFPRKNGSAAYVEGKHKGSKKGMLRFVPDFDNLEIFQNIGINILR